MNYISRGTLLFIPILIILTLMGCEKTDTSTTVDSSTVDNSTLKSSVVKSNSKNEHDLFPERLKELEKMNITNEQSILNISGVVNIVTVEDERYLSIDATFDKPNKVMYDTLVLMVFDQSLTEYIIADYPYVTNYTYQGTTIYPDKDPKGFSVGRAMPLNDQLVDKDKFIDIFKKVKFLIAYEDEAGKLKKEYLVSDNFVIDSKLLDEFK